MGLIIFSIILFVAAFIGLGFMHTVKVTTKNRYGEESTNIEYKWGINKFQLLTFLTLLILIPGFIARVPANSVGIKYSPFTGTSETTLDEGYHLKNPIDKVYIINTQVQTVKIDKGITTQTLDSQFVTTVLDVKYKVDPKNAFLVFKNYKTLNNFSKSSVQSIVQKALELVSTKYDVISILGSKRADVYKEIEISLTKEFAKEGITYKNIIINDMDAGKAIEKAIEDQAVAEKAVVTAQATLAKTKTEAEQASVKAEAEKKAASIEAQTTIINAQAKADAEVIAAKANAESNKLIQNSLSSAVLRKLALDNWDGVLPKVYGSDNPMLDISALLTGEGDK